MKRLSIAVLLVASLLMLVFSGCSMQLEQPNQEPGVGVGVDGAIDYKLNPELLVLERQQDSESAAEELMAEGAIDYVLNPELLFLERQQTVSQMAEADYAPTGIAVTGVSYVVGEWICEQEDGHQLIRMDPDGRLIRVLGPNDAVEIGQFWFSDGAFHVVSDVDNATNESAFHAFIESDESGTYLRFEQCGGNCADAGDIEWLNGLTRS